jgi:hypothetical protein
MNPEEPKSKRDFFELVFYFDDDGQLERVEPGKNTEGYKVEEIKSLDGLNFYCATALLYGHGSPGFTTIRLGSGYIKIIKPQ